MRTTIVLALTLGACAADPVDPCREAADHVQACTGETPLATTSCDPQAADELLARDCSQLAADNGKGDDGYGPKLLCKLGFASYCTWQFEGTFTRADGTPLRDHGIQQLYDIGAIAARWTDDRGVARFETMSDPTNQVGVQSVDDANVYHGAVTCEGMIEKTANFATVQHAYTVTFKIDPAWMVESCDLVR